VSPNYVIMSCYVVNTHYVSKTQYVSSTHCVGNTHFSWNYYKPLSTLLSVVWICSMYCKKKNANSFLTIFGRPQDKIKLSLCTPRRYIEGEEEEEEVYLHTFLTSELDEVWWSRTKQNRLLCFDWTYSVFFIVQRNVILPPSLSPLLYSKQLGSSKTPHKSFYIFTRF